MNKLVWILFAAFLIRASFIFQPGFAADVAYWKSWSLATVDHGIVWTTAATNYNYAPAFLYFLKAVGYVYLIFENPVNYNHYWQANNIIFLAVIKLPVIACDLFTIWGVWWIVERIKNKSLPSFALLPGGYQKSKIKIITPTYAKPSTFAKASVDGS